MKKALLSSLFSALIIILIVILLFTIACVYVRLDQEKYKEFSVEKWENHPRKRWLMIDDFEAKYPVQELNKERVVELLGGDGINFSYEISNHGVLGEYYGLGFNEEGICTGRGRYFD